MTEDVKQQAQIFLDNFGVKLPLEAKVVGKQLFHVPVKIGELANQIPLDPFSIGLMLGEAKSRRFVPSFALLDLCKGSENRVVIANDAQWLFLCGRDIFLDNVLRKGKLNEQFLVVNEQGEVLGLGCFAQVKGKRLLKNVFDRGDFLRREERKKK